MWRARTLPEMIEYTASGSAPARMTAGRGEGEVTSDSMPECDSVALLLGWEEERRGHLTDLIFGKHHEVRDLHQFRKLMMRKAAEK
jgi:hypothetical protein